MIELIKRRLSVVPGIVTAIHDPAQPSGFRFEPVEKVTFGDAKIDRLITIDIPEHVGRIERSRLKAQATRQKEDWDEYDRQFVLLFGFSG